MTYTLFEHVKENLESLLENQPESVEVTSGESKEICDSMKNATLKGIYFLNIYPFIGLFKLQ